MTELANPFTDEIVIVDEPVPPTPRATLLGLALMLKSMTVKVTVVEWDMEPLVPVTVTLYVPAGPLQDKAEVCVPPSTRLAGFREQFSPDGDTDDARDTVPVNPLIGATVIVDVPVAPAGAETPVGLAEILKSVLDEDWESLHAVNGWSSQWPSGSQKTKP